MGKRKQNKNGARVRPYGSPGGCKPPLRKTNPRVQTVRRIDIGFFDGPGANRTVWLPVPGEKNEQFSRK
jgi:hypothetical protein